MLTRIFLYFFLFFLISTTNAYSLVKPIPTDTVKKPKKDEFFCLEVRGTLTYQEKKLDKLDVLVYCDGEIVDQYNTEDDKSFSVGFFKGRDYSLVIKKQGYVPVVIMVSTEIKKKEEEDKLYRFYFETDMKPLKNNLNKNYTDYPAACLRFYTKEDAFNISEKYNRFIKAALKGK